MGLGIHEVELLDQLISTRRIQSACSLGRPALILEESMEARHRVSQSDREPERDRDGFPYWESFLQNRGVTQVASIDQSDYEGASHRHDLNLPIPKPWKGKWQLVVDPGTSEHIHNFPQAVQNLKDLACPGGWILGVWPAEGMCGHGFFQISPEYVFRTFSGRGGFAKVKVWLVTGQRRRDIVPIRDPSVSGGRTLSPGRPAAMLFLVRKKKSLPGKNPVSVQQSDYVASWRQPARNQKTTPPKPSTVWLRRIFGKVGFARLYALRERWRSRLHGHRTRAVSPWPPARL